MKKETLAVIGVAVIALIALGFLSQNNQLGEGDNGNGSGPNVTPTPTPYNPSATPTPPTSSGQPPTTLHIAITPNPIDAGDMLYGTITSDAVDYVVTVHGKHVGEGTENSFNTRTDEHGFVYQGEPIGTAGYWDFWVTSDNGVTSNTPRLTVIGAQLYSSRTFCSRILNTMDVHFDLFCHSAGSATVFANDGSSSIPLDTIHINSGGYGSLDYNFASWGLGTYEIDYVVNGIKASDYGNSVWITLGR